MSEPVQYREQQRPSGRAAWLVYGSAVVAAVASWGLVLLAPADRQLSSGAAILTVLVGGVLLPGCLFLLSVRVGVGKEVVVIGIRPLLVRRVPRAAIRDVSVMDDASSRFRGYGVRTAKDGMQGFVLGRQGVSFRVVDPEGDHRFFVSSDNPQRLARALEFPSID